jgi:hypothetical protein
LTVQAGATYAFNERWFLDGVVSYTWLKNTTTLSTGQTQPMTLNPVAFADGHGLQVLKRRPEPGLFEVRTQRKSRPVGRLFSMAARGCGPMGRHLPG